MPVVLILFSTYHWKSRHQNQAIFSHLKRRWWEGCLAGMHRCHRCVLTHPFLQWEWFHSQLPSSASLKTQRTEAGQGKLAPRTGIPPTNKWTCSVLLGMPPSKSPEVLAFSSHVCSKTFLISTWGKRGKRHRTLISKYSNRYTKTWEPSIFSS